MKSKGKETEKTKLPPKPKKATFRRYTPDDLAGVMEMQRLLTPEECDDPNLFRFKWSDPILFGTKSQVVFAAKIRIERISAHIAHD